MSSTENVSARFRETRFFLKNALQSDAPRILVAFSGGPDSTVLLSVLVQLQDTLAINVGAAYYNHNLRGREAAFEEEHHAEEAARWMGVDPLHRGGAAPGAIKAFAVDNDISLEEAARIERYDFLKTIAVEKRYDYIATGHTRDDHI